MKQEWLERLPLCSPASTQDESCLRGNNVHDLKKKKRTLSVKGKTAFLKQLNDWRLSGLQIASPCEYLELTQKKKPNVLFSGVHKLSA